MLVSGHAQVHHKIGIRMAAIVAATLPPSIGNALTTFKAHTVKIMSSLLLVLSLFCASEARPQEASASTSKSLSRAEIGALFLYGRANYFRAIIKQRKCADLDPAAFSATSQKLEDARARLATQYGERVFPVDKPVDPIPDGLCDRATLMSYANHVNELEQFLANPPAN